MRSAWTLLSPSSTDLTGGIKDPKEEWPQMQALFLAGPLSFGLVL